MPSHGTYIEQSIYKPELTNTLIITTQQNIYTNMYSLRPCKILASHQVDLVFSTTFGSDAETLEMIPQTD